MYELHRVYGIFSLVYRLTATLRETVEETKLFTQQLISKRGKWLLIFKIKMRSQEQILL